MPITETLLDTFLITRKESESICAPLEIEDYVVQPIEDVSPPKWHLGHTTWFFEEFLLKPYLKGYKVYDEDFSSDFIIEADFIEENANFFDEDDDGNLVEISVICTYTLADN